MKVQRLWKVGKVWPVWKCDLVGSLPRLKSLSADSCWKLDSFDLFWMIKSLACLKSLKSLSCWTSLHPPVLVLSLDFTINRFFVKFLKTSTFNVITECQPKFHFVMPSVEISNSTCIFRLESCSIMSLSKLHVFTYSVCTFGLSCIWWTKYHKRDQSKSVQKTIGHDIKSEIVA